MSESDSGPDSLNKLAYEFADRFRRGERPSLTEYTGKHPELAAEIRDLFPALAVTEQFGSVAGPQLASTPRPRLQMAPHRGTRRVPHPSRDRPRRHGHRLRGSPGIAGPARGLEGAAVPEPA